MAKKHKIPLSVHLLLFLIMYYKYILVEAFYLYEDILSKQFPVITKQIHHLADRCCVPCFDLYQPQDI